MASGLLQGENREFLWNVDAHVGPGCPNNADDVALVQMGFVAWGKILPQSPQKTAASAVKVGAPYNGSPTDPLTVAIKVLQAARGGPQDGKISPAKQVPTMAAAMNTWIITGLMLYLRDDAVGVWPHLHKKTGCTAPLSTSSKRVFPVS